MLREDVIAYITYIAVYANKNFVTYSFLYDAIDSTRKSYFTISRIAMNRKIRLQSVYYLREKKPSFKETSSLSTPFGSLDNGVGP